MVGINLGFAGLPSDIRLSLVRAVKVAKPKCSWPTRACQREVHLFRSCSICHQLLPFAVSGYHGFDAAVSLIAAPTPQLNFELSLPETHQKLAQTLS